MKFAGYLKRFGYGTLLLFFCALLFNYQPRANNDNQNEVKGSFISALNHWSGFTADDDHTIPVDNEEDEDDDEDSVESLAARSCQEFIVYTSYHIHQDRLFCNPHGELVSPPPKI